MPDEPWRADARSCKHRRIQDKDVKDLACRMSLNVCVKEARRAIGEVQSHCPALTSKEALQVVMVCRHAKDKGVLPYRVAVNVATSLQRTQWSGKAWMPTITPSARWYHLGVGRILTPADEFALQSLDSRGLSFIGLTAGQLRRLAGNAIPVQLAAPLYEAAWQCLTKAQETQPSCIFGSTTEPLCSLVQVIVAVAEGAIARDQSSIVWRQRRTTVLQLISLGEALVSIGEIAGRSGQTVPEAMTSMVMGATGWRFLELKRTQPGAEQKQRQNRN